MNSSEFIVNRETNKMSAALQMLDENSLLSEQSPLEIVEWALSQNKKAIVTTSFGPFSAVMLHLATRVKADVPIIWVDSGYNTLETYT